MKVYMVARTGWQAFRKRCETVQELHKVIDECLHESAVRVWRTEMHQEEGDYNVDTSDIKDDGTVEISGRFDNSSLVAGDIVYGTTEIDHPVKLEFVQCYEEYDVPKGIFKVLAVQPTQKQVARMNDYWESLSPEAKAELLNKGGDDFEG